jgi:hypothetical protein
MTEFDWHEEPVPAGFPVRQVHGWLADETGRFLLQDRVQAHQPHRVGGEAGLVEDPVLAQLAGGDPGGGEAGPLRSELAGAPCGRLVGAVAGGAG